MIDQNSAFILLSSPKLEDMVSILYAKEYNILPIKNYYKGQYENSVISYGNDDNDTLRSDTLFLLSNFNENCAIIKYKGEVNAKKIFKDGSEIILDALINNVDDNNISYLNNGISFSFVESKRYWKPTNKDDFKVGMLVEYFSNNEWHEKKIENPDQEYEKLYKLLIKYDKVRVPSVN